MHWLKHKDLYGTNATRGGFVFGRRILTTGIIGPISSVTVMGQTIVIINGFDVATDLLNKRSAVYSSRPKLTFASEMFVICLLNTSCKSR